MDKIKTLSKYGTVMTCKIINDQIVTIVITKGFGTKVTTTFEFIQDCTKLFPDYPIVETMITEPNIAIVVLTK